MMSMVGRTQAVVAVVMAYVVMLILVSPVVPSPMTTIRSKHTLQPPHAIAPVISLLFTASSDSARILQWMIATSPAHPASGSDVVDLTTARLC